MADKVQEKDEKSTEGAKTEGNSEEAKTEKKEEKSSKKKMIIILLPLLLIIGGVVGVYFSGLSEKLFGKIKPAEETEEVVEEENAAPADAKDVPQATAASNIAFYDLPEMLVNINANSRKQSYLKTVITLELNNGNQIPKLEAVLPRVIDTFQVYLRELRIEDLQGSAGMYRLKEELLERLNRAADPVQVNDVLFKEMLVQ